MPDSQIVGDAVILDSLGKGADREFRPPHEGRAFVEGTVVVHYQIVFKFDDTGGHGRFEGSEPSLQGFTPQENSRFRNPRFAPEGAAAVAVSVDGSPRLG